MTEGNNQKKIRAVEPREPLDRGWSGTHGVSRAGIVQVRPALSIPDRACALDRGRGLARGWTSPASMHLIWLQSVEIQRASITWPCDPEFQGVDQSRN